MPKRNLRVPHGRARELVREAFERTDGIEKIREKGDKVVGVTGINITNWGTKVVAEFTYSTGDGCSVLVTGSKRVPIDLAANPDEHVERFMFVLDRTVEAQTPRESTA